MTILEALSLILYLPVWLWHECNSVIIRVFIAFSCATVLMPLWDFINEYVYNDWRFAKFFLVILTVDTFFGIWKHWKYKTICFGSGLKKISEKLAVAGGTLIMFHVFQHFGAEPGDQGWIDIYVLYLKGSLIFTYIGFGTAENIYEITGGKFPPPWIMTRFKNYDDKGKRIIEVITDDKHEVQSVTAVIEKKQ